MLPLIRLHPRAFFALLLLMLFCAIGIISQVLAVTPRPDAQYPYGKGVAYAESAAFPFHYNFEAHTTSDYFAVRTSLGSVFIYSSADRCDMIWLSPSITFWSCAGPFNPTPKGYITYLSFLPPIYTVHGDIVTLDVSGLTDLQELWCMSSHTLRKLNVRGCSQLFRLQCMEEQIEALDVANCTSLVNLICDSNKIRSLEIHGNTALRIVSAGFNNLTSLDASDCVRLESLYCDNNKLTSLSVRGDKALNEFFYGNNPLQQLDITGTYLPKKVSVDSGVTVIGP